MKISLRDWWQTMLVRCGALAVVGTLLTGTLHADPASATKRRIPMRPASYVQPTEPEGEPAEEPERAQPVPMRPAPAKTAPAVREPEAWVEEAYDEEPVDRLDHHHRVWGPVWYGDCERPPEPWLAPRCGPPRWYVNAEYVLWSQRGMSVPALVTSSFQGTALEDAGVLGLATTTVLYGNQTLGDSTQSGGRLTVGRWIDDCQYVAIGGRGFILDTQNTEFSATSPTNTILARPYFDVSSGQAAQQNSLVIAYPNVQTGGVQVTSSADVAGGDFFLRRMIHESELSRVDFWIGYQFARITGDLTIASNSTEASGAELAVTDQFSTRNEYHGAAFGFMTTIERECWRLNLLTKMGLGRMHQSANLTGSNSLTDGTNTTTDNVGLLVRSTNSGLHTNNAFSMSPEINLTWSYRLTRSLDASIGYSLVYWTNVLTPGGAIDPNLAVNLDDPPTGNLNPQMQFLDHAYWVQGVSFGLSGRF